MTQDLWSAVDRYFAGSLLSADAALEAALEASTAAGLPAIAVSPLQGKLLMQLAQIQGARRILEIGTLGGYSAIWLGRALPNDGRLVTLEISAKHAEVARANLARADLAERVEVLVGPALQTLPSLQEREPFDLTFIDADKPSNADYFSWAMKLSRKGSIIVVDNVVRSGAVADATSQDPNVLGVHRLNELIAREPRVDATAIQTVGSKGYDGFILARMKG